ncbi:MAG: DMT family transporter [Clostridia bacterium]|nr:DMT family transporter [Clostridia bacterium]
MNSTKSPSSGRYETMLMVTTLAWSMSFIWSKVVTNTGMASEMYLFIRYSLAGIILFPFAFKYLKTMNKKEFWTGILMGNIFFFSMIAQTIGISMSTPAESSFITTAYVVIAPFTTWMLLKQKPRRITWAAVALCLAGIYILNMKPGQTIGLTLGNALTLLGALGWAFQLTFTSIAGRYMPPALLSFLSFGYTGVMGGLTALVTGSMFTTTRAQISGSATAICLAAIFPTVLANLVQVYAQPHVDANKAAVIYTLEAVFATIISILMGMEDLRTSVIVGGGLIACAVLLTQLGGETQDA